MKPYLFIFEQSLTDYDKSLNHQTKVAFLLIITVLFLTFLAGEPIAGILLIPVSLIFLLKNWEKAPSETEGRWKVIISESELIWHSPATLTDKTNYLSFRINLDDIEKFQSSYSDYDDNSPIRFIMKDKTVIKPSINFFMNKSDFMQVLTSQNIPYERVSDFSKRS